MHLKSPDVLYVTPCRQHSVGSQLLLLWHQKLKFCTFCQIAKSGRRARLAADQSSFEDSRHGRKSSTSASGEVCDHVITYSRLMQFHPTIYNRRHEFALCFCLTHEWQDDDTVGSMDKTLALCGFCCYSSLSLINTSVQLLVFDIQACWDSSPLPSHTETLSWHTR